MHALKLLSCLFLLYAPASGQALPRFQVEPRIEAKTAAQREKMRRALTVFEQVMNDELFQAELLKSTFKSDMGDDDPRLGLSTPEVAGVIYGARELGQTTPNERAKVHWVIENRSWSRRWFRDPDCGTYGHVSWEDERPETTVYTYACFIDDEEWDLSQVVGHIAHEWTHTLGFVHRYKEHDERRLTVPYAFGVIVCEHAKRITRPPNAAGIACNF